MPVWLATFLVQLLEPIVMGIIDRLQVAARLNALEKNSDVMKEAFGKIEKAKSSNEFSEAVKSISSGWNHP